ncbi:MAG: PASTA domain-containing protein [bacterium]|jgi:serine/threonine protein kinase|nr:PASTA domain-containing protein [bacterium]
MTGKMLNDRYLILAEIGSGDITAVYKAMDTLLNREVAVKILHRQLASESVVEEFHRVARNLAGLSHPYITNTYASYRDGDIHYLVQELMAGTVKNSRTFPLFPNEAVRTGVQICEALKYAHKTGLLHGHLVPGNIHYDLTGTVKLNDFSMATAIARISRDAVPLTMAGVLYISPEQIKGELPSEASDMYMVGINLYEMVCGKVPFNGDTVVKIAYDHLHEKPLSPRYNLSMIDEELDKLIDRLLDKDPARRYRTVELLLKALRDIFIGGDTFTPSPSNITDGTKDNDAFDDDKEEYAGNLRTLRAGGRHKRPPSAGKIILLAGLILVLGVLISKLPLNIFPAEVTMPDVRGKSIREAEQILEDRKLHMKIVGEKYDNTYAVGTVLSTEPAAGRMVRQNRLVFVIISKGIETAEVPDLYNNPYDSALRALSEAGLTASKPEERYDAFIPKGYVAGQSPQPQSIVPKGSRIAIILSQGPEPEETVSSEAEGVKKSAVVNYQVPNDGKRHRIRVMVTDSQGERIYLDKLFQPGENVQQEITGFDEVSVNIYVDGRLVREETF